VDDSSSRHPGTFPGTGPLHPVITVDAPVSTSWLRTHIRGIAPPSLTGRWSAVG